MSRFETRVATNDRNAVSFQKCLYSARHAVANALFPLLRLCHVDGNRAFNVNPHLGSLIGQSMQEVTGRDHRLRRNTSHVQTNAAHVFTFNDRGFFSQLSRTNRRYVTTRSCANNNNIKVLSHLIAPFLHHIEHENTGVLNAVDKGFQKVRCNRAVNQAMVRRDREIHHLDDIDFKPIFAVFHYRLI